MTIKPNIDMRLGVMAADPAQHLKPTRWNNFALSRFFTAIEL